MDCGRLGNRPLFILLRWCLLYSTQYLGPGTRRLLSTTEEDDGIHWICFFIASTVDHLAVRWSNCVWSTIEKGPLTPVALVMVDEQIEERSSRRKSKVKTSDVADCSEEMKRGICTSTRRTDAGGSISPISQPGTFLSILFPRSMGAGSRV